MKVSNLVTISMKKTTMISDGIIGNEFRVASNEKSISRYFIPVIIYCL